VQSSSFLLTTDLSPNDTKKGGSRETNYYCSARAARADKMRSAESERRRTVRIERRMHVPNNNFFITLPAASVAASFINCVSAARDQHRRPPSTSSADEFFYLPALEID
jgi:hypothetical protein